jgi:hypothetical protein
LTGPAKGCEKVHELRAVSLLALERIERAAFIADVAGVLNIGRHPVEDLPGRIQGFPGTERRGQAGDLRGVRLAKRFGLKVGLQVASGQLVGRVGKRKKSGSSYESVG